MSLLTLHHHRATLLVGAACLVLGSAGGAVAGSMITGAQIKDGSVTHKDVKDGSLRSKDLSEDALAELRGPRGEPGPVGEAGPPGPPGAPGYQVVDGPGATVPGGGTTTLEVSCPSGAAVLGGGARDGSGQPVDLISGGPVDVDTWSVFVANPSGSPATRSAYAICTNP